jgi:hypothetical protein
MITEFGCPNCGSSDYESQGEWEWISGSCAEQKCICRNCNQHFIARIGPVETIAVIVQGVHVRHAKEDIIYDGKTREELIGILASRDMDGLDMRDFEHLFMHLYDLWPNDEIVSCYRDICGNMGESNI